METKFEAGDIVHIDEESDVFFKVVHVEGLKAWVEPQSFTEKHRHISTALMCWCKTGRIIETNRLWHTTLI